MDFINLNGFKGDYEILNLTKKTKKNKPSNYFKASKNIKCATF